MKQELLDLLDYDSVDTRMDTFESGSHEKAHVLQMTSFCFALHVHMKLQWQLDARDRERGGSRAEYYGPSAHAMRSLL
jgi:hypothetical protein